MEESTLHVLVFAGKVFYHLARIALNARTVYTAIASIIKRYRTMR